MSNQKNVHGFKQIKLRSTTVDLLDKEISKILKTQPYLKGAITYNAIILMLLSENKIKLSKKRYLINKLK